jgi:hypothetical protein
VLRLLDVFVDGLRVRKRSAAPYRRSSRVRA